MKLTFLRGRWYVLWRMISGELRTSPAVFVDLETTGFSVDHDRAIEIAAMRYEAGILVDAFHSLLDPRMRIPARIEQLTGISDHMVRDAPILEDVLPRLIDLLDGAVMVAHNLAFDFSFLRRAAVLSRRDFSPSRLCSLRLARRALKNLPSHRLDALARELNLPVEPLHRAQPHAQLTAEVYLRLVPLVDDALLESCLEAGGVGEPAQFEPDIWKSLPAGSGVYLLKDREGHVVYIGKSMNLRRRVREHLRQRWHPQPRLRREMGRVSGVEVIETDTELEALFLESRLIKQYQPDGNSAERRERLAVFLAVDRSARLPILRIVSDPHRGAEEVYGPFGSRTRLEAGARALADAVGLCAYGDPSLCSPSIPRHCLGPCGLQEAASQYGDAVDSALALLRGDDPSLLDYLRQRRDHEADGLNFETAAALRDRILALEQLVGDERWRQDVRAMHGVLILPSERDDQRKLVFLRGNRLVGTGRVLITASRRELKQIMRTAIESRDESNASPNEVAEEMRLVQGWLRRVSHRYPMVAIELDYLDEAVSRLRSVLGHPMPNTLVSA
ncbi:MAG: exonuclease domain-containing protein [Chloroflexota bacterium]